MSNNEKNANNLKFHLFFLKNKKHIKRYAFLYITIVSQN